MEELVLEDDAECPVNAKSSVLAALERPIEPDWVLVIGFIVCAAGWYLGMFWLILGGFLFFLLGIQAIEGRALSGGGGEPKIP